MDKEHSNYDELLVSNNFEFDQRKLKGFEGFPATAREIRRLKRNATEIEDLMKDFEAFTIASNADQAELLVFDRGVEISNCFPNHLGVSLNFSKL